MKENIAKIELTENQYGSKKQIIFASGKTLNITPKNRCFSVFNLPGVYDIATKEFNGKEVIVSAKRIGDAENQPTTANKGISNVAAQTLDKKLEFDKNRQKDIIIECYMGIAKDILIANKKAEPIKAVDVMDFAAELVLCHNKILNGYNPAIESKVHDVTTTFGGEVVDADYNPEQDLPM